MPVEPKKILVIEDVAETRNWLNEILLSVFPHTVITEAATLVQARAALNEQHFDLALIDIHLPDGSGFELLKEISLHKENTYCVINTVFGDDEHLFEALRLGAQGYLLKDHGKEQFAMQLRGIVDDQPPLSPAIARRVLQCFGPQKGEDLTPREMEVLALIAQGLRLKDVAVELKISAYTVGDHVKKIYRKLQVNSRAEAALHAVQRGLIPPTTT